MGSAGAAGGSRGSQLVQGAELPAEAVSAEQFAKFERMHLQQQQATNVQLERPEQQLACINEELTKARAGAGAGPA